MVKNVRKYHYEYECRTNNLCYGGLLIGRYNTPSEARFAGNMANKGVFDVKKVRVYND